MPSVPKTEYSKLKKSKRAETMRKYDVFRRDVFKRDNFTCAVCGHQHVQGSKYLSPHHVYGRIGKLLLDVTKAVTVCCLCHSKVHSGNATTWREYFEKKLQNVYGKNK